MPPEPERSIQESYVLFAKAVADPMRLEMLTLIGSAGEFACTALEEILPIGKSTISYHVKILSQAGLVTVRKEGRFFFYRLQADVLNYYMPNALSRLLAEQQASG